MSRKAPDISRVLDLVAKLKQANRDAVFANDLNRGGRYCFALDPSGSAKYRIWLETDSAVWTMAASSDQLAIVVHSIETVVSNPEEHGFEVCNSPYW